jgi:hypothetical protein
MMRNDKAESDTARKEPDQGRRRTVLALMSVLGASLGLSSSASAGEVKRWVTRNFKIEQANTKSTTSKSSGPQQGRVTPPPHSYRNGVR